MGVQTESLFALFLVGGAFAVGWVAAVVTGRTGDRQDSPSVVGRGLRATVFVVVAASFVIVLRFDPGRAVTAVTGSPWSGAAANAGVIVALVLAGREAARAGARPGIEQLRAGDYSPPPGARVRIAAAVAVCLFGPAFLLTARAAGVFAFDPVLLVPVFALAYGLYTFLTFPFRLDPVGGLRVRDPTADERARIERCYERFGRSPNRIVVTPADGDPGVAVAGGRFHTVGITEPFLQGVDDEALTIALAQADERARGGFALWTAVFTALLLLFVGAVVVTVLSLVGGGVRATLVWGGVALAALVALLPMAWLSHRSIFRADEFVTTRFEPARVAAVYRELGPALQYVAVDPDNETGESVSPDPHVATRIERIDADGPESTEEGRMAAEKSGMAAEGGETATEHDATPAGSEADGQSPTTRWRGTVRRTAVFLAAVAVLAPVWNGPFVQGLPPLARQSVVVAAVVAWALLPVSIYLDSNVTRRFADWPADRLPYVVAACVPVLDVAVALWYLNSRPSLSTGEEESGRYAEQNESEA